MKCATLPRPGAQLRIRTSMANAALYQQGAGRTRARAQLEKAIDKLGTGDMRALGHGTGVQITKRLHVRGAMRKAPDKPYQDLAAPIDCSFTAFPSAMEEEERPRNRAHERCQRSRQNPRRHKSGNTSANEIQHKDASSGVWQRMRAGAANVLTLPASRLRYSG